MRAPLFALLAVMLAMNATAHMHMKGPLPKEIIEHSDDIDYLKKHAGLDTQDRSKGLFGLHYYYGQDADARKLTLKLLNANDSDAQLAALRIVAHCGGYDDQDIVSSLILRLDALSSSRNSKVRTNVLDAVRTLLRREKGVKNRAALLIILRTRPQASGKVKDNEAITSDSAGARP